MSSEESKSRLANAEFLKNVGGEDVLSWREVNKIHRVRHGIYQRGGRLISLLTDFGKINQCYPDTHGSSRDTIFYTGAGRRGDQPLDSFNLAMFNAVETKHGVPLFNKLSAGHWNFLGFWTVTEGKYIYDENQKRMIWKFTLRKNSRKMIEIRKATKGDEPRIWKIIEPVIAAGVTYVFAPDSSEEKMLAFWCGADKATYVALLDDKIVGTFFIKANQPDLGAHVANAGYMVAPEAAGKGVGKRMAEFSIGEAKRLGYLAMQFNFVVKSNEPAVRLWQKLGFEIVGEIPEAFRHRENGLTNAYIMYRKL